MSISLPPIYSFPPLYTRQPNSLTRRQQINSWIEIILQYGKARNGWCMTAEGCIVAEGMESNNESIFVNTEIQRSVPQVFINEIWSTMCQEGKAIGMDKGKKESPTYYIFWRSLDSWASLILQWFESAGKLQQVVTIYELTQGDESIGWEFHGMPEPLTAHCLESLCQRHRATLVNDEYGKPVAVKVV
ncbi:VPS25 (YJR102C) [Zygosaccharomyces parabailii]|nr:VPS25 (YJR102C) [Zygosaccharomyces parabailii]CDH11502.1 probable Vacuolar protein-sorting-associated protein 25 [Zygosaccharomyces bailii ISA1307]